MAPQHQAPPTNHYQPLPPQQPEIKVIENREAPRINGNKKKRKKSKKTKDNSR